MALNTRTWCKALGTLLAAGWLMGLGGGPEQTAETIPIPSRSFQVQVTDSEGNSLRGSRFTWEGRVSLRAQYGNATITIPFEKLSVLEIGESVAPERVNARAVLKSGETLELTMDATSKCYAETEFGNYEIFVSDLSRVEFQG